MGTIKYRCDVVEKDGHSFYFITKRNAFQPDQISMIIEDIFLKETPKEPEQPKATIKKSRFHRPVDAIFLGDIKLGLKHCLEKYNVDKDTFLAEAEECFPTTDVRKMLNA